MPDRRPRTTGTTRTTRRSRPWVRLSAVATTLGLLTGCTNLATSPDTAPTGQDSGTGLFDDTVVHDLDIEFDPEAYDAQAAKLVSMFADNFAQYESHVGEDVRAAAVKAA